MEKKYFLFVVVFFTATLSYSQLADFTIKVDVTDQTCLGNGSLTITTSGTTQGASIAYLTYKLPETKTPISSSTTVNGLSDGDYRVVVTQTLDTLSNSQQKDVTIANKVVDLNYSISSDLTSGCGVTGNIIVKVLTGSAEFFEIIKGPKTFPKQISNQFKNLPEGQYRIRVYDKCGEAVARDYTLVIPVADLNIGSVNIPKNLTSCNSTDVTNEVTPTAGATIAYPLHIVYTIHPPNGDPDKTVVQDISSGPADLLKLTLALDLYGNSEYTYDVKVTDNCGKDFSLNGNAVGPFPKAVIMDSGGKCGGKYMVIEISNFSPTYKITFTKAPAGFDPKSFNSAYPGPFSNSTSVYGNETKTVPFGIYEVEITDACGRTNVAQHEVTEGLVYPLTLANNAGCDSQFGNIRIHMPDFSKILSVIMIKAPANYQSSVPSDVSSHIDGDGIFFIENLPLGKYDFIVTDDCGKKIEINGVEVPVFVKQGLDGKTLPNCTPGSGSVSVFSGNGALKNIQITKAPAAFAKALPYDVSYNISAGQLVMSDLPAGDYEFAGIDACDYHLVYSTTVIGYDYDSSQAGFSIERNCGSFNLTVADPSNGVYNQSFWLQKLNSATNVWEHPFTGVDYPEGSVPDATNSMSIDNNSTVYNIALTGEFRVIKTFQGYANAASPSMFKDCIQILGDFKYSDELKILGAYSLDCTGGPGADSVVLDVAGVPPYTYKITEKEGDPSFIVDNGSNNVFSNLAPATYNFQVQDDCGGLKNGKYTVGALPKLVVANTPSNMILCGDGSSKNGSFDLTKQDSAILGIQNPSIYKVTYYLNSADANAGTNPVSSPNLFPNNSNPQTIYARVINTEIQLCYDTTSFDIYLGITPVLTMAQKEVLCAGDSKMLYANPGSNDYKWSTGATTDFINITEAGTYSVTVKNNYGNLSCESSRDIVVAPSSIAHFEKIEVNDWNDNSNSIKIMLSGQGDYEYSLDNINFQSDSVFTDLKPGVYVVYVRDKNGCGIAKADVVILSYSKFFTPNGDGNNDKWKIDFSILEPGIKVYIYDRLGKLITGIDSQSAGWDGTYNGEMLPSTDYWFMAERADGRVYRGHFAMIR